MPFGGRAWIATVVLVTAGCGAAPPPESPPLTFAGPAAVSVASASGALAVAIRWSPAQPTVGYDASQLSVTDQAGTPVSGATLTVVPWMPAHGHGGSVLPTVMETAPGIYVATPLDFYMSGTWALRTRIVRAEVDAATPIDDTAEPRVDVP